METVLTVARPLQSFSVYALGTVGAVSFRVRKNEKGWGVGGRISGLAREVGIT